MGFFEDAIGAVCDTIADVCEGGSELAATVVEEGSEVASNLVEGATEIAATGIQVGTSVVATVTETLFGNEAGDALRDRGNAVAGIIRSGGGALAEGIRRTGDGLAGAIRAGGLALAELFHRIADQLRPPPERIDVHCHLCSRVDVIGLVLRQLLALNRQTQHVVTTPILSTAAARSKSDILFIENLEEILTTVKGLQRLCNMLTAAKVPNPVHNYRRLQRTYRYQYAVVPLQLDFAYCHDRDVLFEIIDELDRQRRLILQFLDDVTHLPAERGHGVAILRNIPWIRHVRREFQEICASILPPGQADQGLIDHLMFDNYEYQLRQLQRLARTARDKVYPFLAVDPRRPGIIEIVKQNVGRGKPFVGVKLYCPMGYSPTDPTLYGVGKDDDCVYRYCSENHIPVTAHLTASGFATLASSVIVTGHIAKIEQNEENEENEEIVIIEEVKNKSIRFETSILNDGYDAATRERSERLNHPDLWRKVLKKFNSLYLNLAHFGSETSWRKKVIELMKDKRFDNVYTDLSCYPNDNELRKLKTEVFDNEGSRVKERVLYGSDYFVLLFYEDNMQDYVNSFRDIFGEADFDAITKHNPKRFLQHVIDFS